MSDIECHLAPVLRYRRPPADTAPSHLLGHECPKGLAVLHGVADGFITTDGLFRVFGFEGDNQLPSLDEWNLSDWKRDYGSLAHGVLFIAEDIFGDQYGYDFRSKRQFVKFYCEGGEIEALDGGLNWFIAALVDPIAFGALDAELIEAARVSGRWPSDNEHLAFKLPLIAGGERNASNLGIESVALHLGMLAQISRQTLDQDDGTPIARFTTPDSARQPPTPGRG